ncbi:sporulation protein YpjB [Salsuginibacillus halophilus]|uniref:Sporulation protein YpjB n=1 Tax=Salsuginibacillus halophilus TaxID=517424 RepID=A0A2P8HWG2_9BACI|nr:sporulation protein YpjB [Salsuginibacillus halophilus]PSL50514.1 sporulation protein YpjB [Salsuginibacillus halophilus]
MWKQWGLTTLMICVLLVPGQAYSENEPLLEAAAAADRLTQEASYAEAKKTLERAGQYLPELRFEEKNLSSDDIGLIVESLQQAQGSLAAVQLSDAERKAYVRAFYYTVQAVFDEEAVKSLGGVVQLEHRLQRTQAKLPGAPVEERRELWAGVQQELLQVQPAMFLRTSPAWQEEVTSLAAHINERVRHEEAGEDELAAKLQTFQQLLFESEQKQSSTDPSLFFVISTMAAFVLTGLTYAGVKKYRGEKERLKAKEEER